MVRASLILAALTLAAPAVGQAEVITVTSELAVDSGGTDPVVRGRVADSAAGAYAGFTPAALPQPDHAGEAGLTFGIRPRVWDAGVDFGYSRRSEAPCCGEPAPGVDRHIGDDATLGARVYFDPVSDSAGAEARAAVTVVRGMRVDDSVVARDALDDALVGVDFGVQQVLADLCRLDPRYRDAALAPARAEANLETGF